MKGWATSDAVHPEDLPHVIEVLNPALETGETFLLVSGEPLNEPVAWYGPIVMNTEEQLQRAFEELREGTFLNRRS